MSTNFIYDWGETVRVVTTAPEEMLPGQLCSVCGMRETDEGNLYLVEFSTGKSKEISEKLLERVNKE